MSGHGAIRMKRILACCIVAAVGMASAYAAVVYTEAWDASDAGWTSSDSLMAVSQAGGVGNPAGSLLGAFAEQGVPSPETDAFYADSSASSGSYTGDYWADLGNFYGWTFNFYAEHILPSAFYMRFSDGVNTYQANLLGQLGGVGSWSTVSTPALSYGVGGWLGPGGLAGLSNALANVQWVEVRFDRNTEIGQNYYLDNFENEGEDPPPPPDGAVPEPGTGVLMLVAMVGCGLIRGAKRLPPPAS